LDHIAMTNMPAELAALFEDLGPQTNHLDWVSFDGEAAAWTVVFDDGMAILLEWDETLERLVVQAPLGRAADHAQVAVHRLVLAYNATWRHNGGARIGMVDTDGELALMLDVPAKALTLEQLQRVLEAVRSTAIALARCVAGAVEEEVDPAASLEARLQRI
jgi:hypothetical protein